MFAQHVGSIYVVTSVLFIGLVAALEQNKDSVTLKSGQQLSGERANDNDGFAYYGIKYGVSKRFEHSVTNTNFAYLNDVSRPKKGPVCQQKLYNILTFLNGRNLTMSEDCLYLDIYLPPTKSIRNRAWPVLFWIHGGSLRIGDKDMFDARLLAKAVDAIVVVINHRMGAFGFLSTGDEVAPGNYGLGDAKLALNWTIDNIPAFNGDTSKITIFGFSSGATLTSAMMLDDYVRSKVSAGIPMSGRLFWPSAVQTNPKERSVRFAAHLGCPTNTSHGIVECLRGVPVDDILQASWDLSTPGTVFGAMPLFQPVVDGKHLIAIPSEVMKQKLLHKSDKNGFGRYIGGIMRGDAGHHIQRSNPQWLWDNTTHSYNTTVHRLATFFATLIGSCNKQDVAETRAYAALRFYNVTNGLSTVEYRQILNDIISEVMFLYPELVEYMLYAEERPADSYLYMNSFDPGFQNVGAFHGLDYLHLFRGPFDSILGNLTSDALTEALRHYIRVIAHTGHPPGLYKDKAGNINQYEEVDQKATWSVKSLDLRERLRFLENLIAPCSS